jgi:hypothetical protein
MKILFSLLTAILLSSCSCNYHLSKLEKKCGKFTQDTLTVHDTLITKEVKTDTIFKQGLDSVIIREGKLTLKYFYNTHDSTVFLSGKCDSDTIIREIRVPYERVNVEVKDYSWQSFAILGIVLCAGALLILRRK